MQLCVLPQMSGSIELYVPRVKPKLQQQTEGECYFTSASMPVVAHVPTLTGACLDNVSIVLLPADLKTSRSSESRNDFTELRAHDV
jgi:hypothetical protein